LQTTGRESAGPELPHADTGDAVATSGWYRVHVAYSAPSIGEWDASAVSWQGKGDCSLSADGSGLPQCWGCGTTGVSYSCLTCPVTDAGAVSCQCCGRPLSLKHSLPVVRFCPQSA